MRLLSLSLILHPIDTQEPEFPFPYARMWWRRREPSHIKRFQDYCVSENEINIIREQAQEDLFIHRQESF